MNWVMIGCWICAQPSARGHRKIRGESVIAGRLRTGLIAGHRHGEGAHGIVDGPARAIVYRSTQTRPRSSRHGPRIAPRRVVNRQRAPSGCRVADRGLHKHISLGSMG